MRVVYGVDELVGLEGTDLGETETVLVDQEQIDRFAVATGDDQWIHVSPERAATGPFAGTIAHGYLTLSMIPALLRGLVRIEGFSHGINYGLNKVRFPSPVRSGSQIAAQAEVLLVERLEGAVQVTFRVQVRTDGATKPACVAEVVYRYLTQPSV